MLGLLSQVIYCTRPSTSPEKSNGRYYNPLKHITPFPFTAKKYIIEKDTATLRNIVPDVQWALARHLKMKSIVHLHQVLSANEAISLFVVNAKYVKTDCSSATYSFLMQDVHFVF